MNRPLIQPEYLDKTNLHICECNEACACSSWPSSRQCTNRVAGKAPINRELSLEVVKTSKMGYGLRTNTPIEKGQYVCRYLGQYITEEICQHKSLRDQRYMWKLQANAELMKGLSTPEKEFIQEESLLIDGQDQGNLSRFINHHCDPNLISAQVYLASRDFRSCEVAFYAKRNIRAHEELFIDYSYEAGHPYFKCDCGPKCVHNVQQ